MKNMRICFVGESYVNGTGDPDCLGWAGRLCVEAQRQGHEVTYYNLGIRGQTSSQIAQHWQSEVSARLPSMYDGRVVFSFGVNDTVIDEGETRQRVSFVGSIENTQQILAAAINLYPTLMVGPPPGLDSEQNERIALLSLHFANICARLSIPYLDIYTPMSTHQVWQQEIAANDAYHPGAAGYAALAGLVYNWSAWQAWFND